jgi:hypothetical protein
VFSTIRISDDSIYPEPCKFLKASTLMLNKRIPNFIIDLHIIRNSKNLLDNDNINFQIKNIFVSILAIRSVLEKTNISD